MNTEIRKSLRAKDAIAFLGVSGKTFYSMVNDGRLPRNSLGLWYVDDVTAFKLSGMGRTKIGSRSRTDGVLVVEAPTEEDMERARLALKAKADEAFAAANPDYMDIGEAAAYMACSIATVRNRLYTGELNWVIDPATGKKHMSRAEVTTYHKRTRKVPKPGFGVKPPEGWVNVGEAMRILKTGYLNVLGAHPTLKPFMWFDDKYSYWYDPEALEKLHASGYRGTMMYSDIVRERQEKEEAQKRKDKEQDEQHKKARFEREQRERMAYLQSVMDEDDLIVVDEGEAAAYVGTAF